MKKDLKGKHGISIQIITAKILKELTKTPSTLISKRTLRNHASSGTFKSSDLSMISIGLQVFEKIVHEGFKLKNNQLLLGSKDVSVVGKNITSYRCVMEDFAHRASTAAKTEANVRRRIENLQSYSQIAQAARDGVIIKQSTRTETINGEKKDIKYDTSMSPQEVIDIFRDYEHQANKLYFKRMDNYLGLGLGVAATIGEIFRHTKSGDKEVNKNASFITIGSIAVSGLKLLYGLHKSDDKENLWKLRDEENRANIDLLGNEQISSQAEQISIQGIESIANEGKKLDHKIENRNFMYSLALDLVTAIIAGAYISKSIEKKENGKIDGASFAQALLTIQSAKGICGNFIHSTQGILNNRTAEEEFQQTCRKVNDILTQMEEKVYPLKGATSPFDSISIKNFNGHFYPKTNYDTGEINYSTILNIPEFSMKRGDVVLLSGESGSGKSTFLRFLERGDINNRNAIELDSSEKVDNLGNQFIAFRPSINLGNETNVLFQITGKKNTSDLTQDERERLETTLKELKFDFPNLLEQLASKKFMEFSTGQQRRLALSKMFYRINDGTSVIIVDEPVGNVENSLIREQLKMIRNYAKQQNVMLLLTTHRLDLAEDLATKRYNINKDGTMVQVPIREQDNEITK